MSSSEIKGKEVTVNFGGYGEYNFPDELFWLIKQGEGFMRTPQDDLQGKVIGYGHNLNTSGRDAKWLKENLGVDITDGCSEAEAKIICKDDLKRIYKYLDKKYEWWRDLDPAGQFVMVDMCYTLGGLEKYPKMCAAIKRGDYEQAAEEILNRKHIEQTGRRAYRQATLMRTGVYAQIEALNPFKPTLDGKSFNMHSYPARENGPDLNKGGQRGAEQRSTAPAQRSSVGRADAPAQRDITTTPRRAAPTRQSVNLEHEQQWIKQIAAGQIFRETATTVAAKGGEKTVIGYNHTIKDNEKKLLKRKITQQDAEGLLRNDLRASGVYERLNANFPWWKDLDPKAQGIMVDMCYNKEIGYTDRTALHGLFEALQKGDYAAAAKELDSIEYPVTYPDDAQRNIRLKQNAAILRELGNQPTHEQTRGDNQTAARQTPAQPARTVQSASRDKTATKQQLRDDSLKAQKILDNFNRQHKRKFENTHTTREGIEAAFAGKDIEASKIITKALMNPTVVAQRLGLTDEHGKPLKSSRAVVEALSKLDSQRDQDKINQMVQLASEMKSRRSR